MKLNHLVLEKYKHLCDEIENYQTEELEEPVYDEISCGNKLVAKQDDRAGSLFCFHLEDTERTSQIELTRASLQ